MGFEEKISKTGYNVKAGASFISGGSVFFANAGVYSRQPFLDNIFVNVRTSNDLVNPEIDNEIIRSFEGGYHFQTATPCRAWRLGITGDNVMACRAKSAQGRHREIRRSHKYNAQAHGESVRRSNR